jgi:hypothetical protein
MRVLLRPNEKREKRWGTKTGLENFSVCSHPIIQAFFPVDLQYPEYRQAHLARLISGRPPRNQGIEYKEVPINSSIIRFAFAVEFAESPQQFGGADLSFSNKKDAKQWAAKKALDWLTGSNGMASTGKRTIDVKALEAEKAAREEIGNNNWVGKLLGLLIPPNIF